MLSEVAQQTSGEMHKALQAAVDEVESQEDEHLEWARETLTEITLQVPSEGQAPPPERWQRRITGPSLASRRSIQRRLPKVSSKARPSQCGWKLQQAVQSRCLGVRRRDTAFGRREGESVRVRLASPLRSQRAL